MTESAPPAGWYPDPSKQFEQRYWDGTDWTEHVVSQATGQAVSPLTPAADRQVQVSRPEQVQRQVRQQAGIAPFETAGAATLFDSPVLVVNQKAKLVEITNEYAIYDANGTQLGSVVEVGQSFLRKALRLVSNVDMLLTHRYEIRDGNGRVVLTVTRPGTLWKSKVLVGLPDGREVGRIVQENLIGKIRFGFEAGGMRVGGLAAENWRAWDFAISDAQGTEVARVKKTWEGLAKAMFTTADNYVVRVHRPLEDPLRSFVLATAVTIDTVLKQSSKG
ncbi:MAG TPA: phospholipid scramblase-related protein [Frankiaceae bacterium]|jgi:uncharacterized protein YxjI|nr:phospholipid scramblase-related protein [Frankiaceae bacterium]